MKSWRLFCHLRIIVFHFPASRFIFSAWIQSDGHNRKKSRTPFIIRFRSVLKPPKPLDTARFILSTNRTGPQARRPVLPEPGSPGTGLPVGSPHESAGDAVSPDHELALLDLAAISNDNLLDGRVASARGVGFDRLDDINPIHHLRRARSQHASDATDGQWRTRRRSALPRGSI